jgi:coronin-7
VSFTVPRLHKDHFQDDIYTATLDAENSLLSADEWVEGKTPQFKLIDLRPVEMPLRKLTL